MKIIKITNKVRYYRERLCLSQEDLAKKCKVAAETISRIETQKTLLPHPKTRKKIAEALEVEINEIFRPVQIKP
ncbi:helix-turn-helix transcriptional regulator [Candidatus Uabimicrobium amorphum]|uniref:Transcriptional regulator n=1 Tax=Uabimicrobium amorphum TaxID=2596890 RepID=A0A5S9F5Q3_UABAM|nr:helix-turn-helix transcriptional regulator [Candidatus Uabimicrobium amorphum]BBM87095.1 transcriptional regulator [Candidatus Uabimicrobium amorphum]